VSAKWVCEYCNATGVGGTEVKCERSNFTAHRICFKCYDRMRVPQSLAEIADKTDPRVRCPDDLPDHERVVLALGNTGQRIPVYRFHGGPADGETRAVEAHHDEVVIPVMDTLTVRSWDVGMDGVVPRGNVEKRAIYKKRERDDGYVYFECINENQL
jgi:hypothetical protein